MVDIQSYQNVAVGDTVADTQKVVPVAHCGKRNGGEYVVGKRFGARATGVIKTIATAVIEGNSHFYVTLRGRQQDLRLRAAWHDRNRSVRAGRYGYLQVC